ncbi:MAG TPA: hypothetical protein VFN53_00605 [Acidobacteriaceae bacterium]|nr:hypothetical protein [Acidobacteriaceae bacterium]
MSTRIIASDASGIHVKLALNLWTHQGQAGARALLESLRIEDVHPRAMIADPSPPLQPRGSNALKKAGLIRYERSIMTVLDSGRLEEGCCECYRAIESQFGRALKVSLPKVDREPDKHDLHGTPSGLH